MMRDLQRHPSRSWTPSSDRPLAQKNGSAFVYGELYLLTSLFDLAYHVMIIVKSVSFYKLPKTVQ